MAKSKSTRPQGFKPLRPLPIRFLIVCEGTKTEPNYFNGFRRPEVALTIVRTGKNTVEVVRIAMERRRQGNYDQVWCVFDRNTFPAQRFNDAIALAAQEGIQVAYSNPAFELWFVLHYELVGRAIGSKDYPALLEGLDPRIENYEKNSRDMYVLLESRQETAIHHAKNLLARYDPPRPADDNPATTVHLLVEELRKFSR